MMKRWLYILIGFALADGFLLEPEVKIENFNGKIVKIDTKLLSIGCKIYKISTFFINNLHRWHKSCTFVEYYA